MPDPATPPTPVPPPVARLDAAGLLAQLRDVAGTDIELVGTLAGGQVGAAVVAWPDGRQGVLTQWGDAAPESWQRIERTGELLALAREAGIPAPRYEIVARLPDRIAIVQERMAGEPPTRVDLALVEELVALAGRGTGLLADRPDLPGLELHLLRSGPGFCLHESLAQYDERTRRLLDVVRRIGTASAHRMAGDDLVHMDLHPGNVLVDRTGAVTGIVDWDGVGRGDHRFALVTLRFDLAAPAARSSDRSARSAAARWLDNRIDDLFDEATLRAYWAHMGLRLVDWAIRHHGPDDVDRWLTVAASRLG